MSTQTKKMGLLSAVLIQMNGMIGAGIVGIPSILVQTSGSVGLLSFLFCILLIFSMTYSLGELALLHGGNAWCYRFPRFWARKTTGLITSLSYIIGLHIALGFVAQEAGIWLHEIIPFLPPSALGVFSVLLIILFIYAGKNVSSLWQYIISSVIVISVILTSVLCFTQFETQLFLEGPSIHLEHLMQITPIILFAFMGFEAITSMYSVIENPRKNILRGGLIGVAIVASLYLLFAISVLGSISSVVFNILKGHSLISILQQAYPEFSQWTRLIYIGGLCAILGTLHSMIWSVNTLIMNIYDIIQKEHLPVAFSHKRLNSTVVLLLSSASILLVLLTLTSEVILYSTVTLLGICYGISTAGLIKSKKWVHKVIGTQSLLGSLIMVIFAIRLLILKI